MIENAVVTRVSAAGGPGERRDPGVSTQDLAQILSGKYDNAEAPTTDLLSRLNLVRPKPTPYDTRAEDF